MKRSFLALLVLVTPFAAVADDHGDFLPLTGRWANPPAAPAPSAGDDTDCRAKIEKVVCYVEGQQGWNRKCLPESARYVPTFQALHDRLSPVLQKMFCSLEKLYVEKDLDSTAYALRGRPVIGIRASLIDEKLSLTHWASWKEQINFGGSKASYEVSDELPSYNGESAPGDDDMVYSIIVHEFAHLFDFANNINATLGGRMKEDSYGAISWKSLYAPKTENEFPGRRKLCFYACSSTSEASEAKTIYAGLFGTSFLNSYTAKNPYEDFADTFSFYFLFKDTTTAYQLDTKQGDTYDLRTRLASPKLAPKVQYIEAFVAKEDKRYP